MTIDVKRLLNRQEVELDSKLVFENVNGKTVLVTGAGGSIGSEICRQIFKFGPKKLILLGHGENSIYEIDSELRELDFERNVEIIPVIADIQNAQDLARIVKQHKPDIIYHAAAHKHLPLMENNPLQAVRNNIHGTLNIVHAAYENHVKTFVMISTDKAVYPTSVMGATKRVAEMVIQFYGAKSRYTKFVTVRFGNVLGSRGSVVPRFEKQILSGGPITVTHPEMTRYFMTIPEASRLVIQAGSLARGQEVFVLDMGNPVKIVDLAKRMIQLSPARFIGTKIEFTGLRPGEKMYEDLMTKGEKMDSTTHKKIFVGKINRFSYDKFINDLTELAQLTGDTAIKDKLQEIVPSYTRGVTK